MTKPVFTDACVREAIHFRLWARVVSDRRPYRDRYDPDWQPDLDVYSGEYYQSCGGPDRDREFPDDFPDDRRLEGWLRDRGIVDVPEDPDDASLYNSHIRGSGPTLRASLAQLEIDADWVRKTAVHYALMAGAHFNPAYGPLKEYRLDRLQTGPGVHPVPRHFAPLIDALTEAGFCLREGQGHFSWTEAVAPHHSEALPYLHGEGPNRWEQRKWELRSIWRKMPRTLKEKYSYNKAPFNVMLLALECGAYYDRKARRWRSEPADIDHVGMNMDLARDLDRLDREDGLPGRRD